MGALQDVHACDVGCNVCNKITEVPNFFEHDCCFLHARAATAIRESSPDEFELRDSISRIKCQRCLMSS